ncbi:MAG: response regulator transcription factor [Chloroflexi bacterium]|nr:response regulator transcription factor [Chloroflexota bacterium]
MVQALLPAKTPGATTGYTDSWNITSALRTDSPSFDGASVLTAREREVLTLVAEGFSNKLIADQLSISERTVKNHLTNIMVKLEAWDRTHAVVTAFRHGWLSL